MNGTTTPGTVTKNTFHNHSWFPLNANYFAASGSRAAMAKVDEFSFVSRTLNSDSITDTLTFTGTLLNNYPGTGKTDQIGFGYCDVHPNKTLGGTIAYNPYQTFTSSSDYDTKAAGTERRRPDRHRVGSQVQRHTGQAGFRQVCPHLHRHGADERHLR